MNVSFSPQATTLLATQRLNENTVLFTLDVSTGARPGQFVNLWLPDKDEKPFSVAFDDGKVTKLAIAAVGPFTRQLSTLQVGDRVGIRGPYGNCFTIPRNQKVVLVGGGFGSAPLHFLGSREQQQGSEITIIIGARTKNLLMYLEICAASDFRVLHTTDDGSAGEHGRVTTPLERLLQNGGVDLVQTCGPEKMMEAVAKLCQQYNVACELSIERYMKCGFGICGQCACDDKIICRDGCIFSGKAALALEDFGNFHRDKEGRKVMY